MYHHSVTKWSPIEEDERVRRDNMTGSSVHQLPPYVSRSPTLNHYSGSSTNGHHPSTAHPTYSSRPSSSAAMPASINIAQSPRLGPPPSPTNGLLNLNRPAGYTPSTSTYYDPTSEHRESTAAWAPSPRPAYSPMQHRDSASYFEHNGDHKQVRSTHHSPISARFPQHSPPFPNLHAHPTSRHDSLPQSPSHNSVATPSIHQNRSGLASNMNGATEQPTSAERASQVCTPQKPVEETKPARVDPMSFSSILSSTVVEPPKTVVKHEPVVKQARRSSKTPNGDAAAPLAAATPSSTPGRKSSHKPSSALKDESVPEKRVKDTPKPRASKVVPSSKLAPTTSDKENEEIAKALEDINNMELSDLDTPAWNDAKERHRLMSQKRQRDVEDGETSKRKRRRTAAIGKMSIQLEAFAKVGKDKFVQLHEDEVVAEVQQKEIQDEKERKKDMQRKRRREKTIQNEEQKQRAAIEKLQLTADNAEREKLLREAQKAEMKAKSTKRILDVGEAPEGIREVTPLALNLEGGTMSTFHTGNRLSPEPPRKKPNRGPTTRPRKSKEKKRAEIDSAEAAHLAGLGIEREDPVRIAPKEENRRSTLTRETKAVKVAKDPSPPAIVTNYASKGYQQIYDQIWKDMARKDVYKVFKIKNDSHATRLSNMRKTAQLAAKEARRWQLRTNKSTKDVQARAKRSMREMMGFWKRNEREERDMRRVAEKQELDNAKKAEADREANRQKRKLNFLISQTELYSHFIGRKIKTDEVERSTDSADVAVSTETVQPGKSAAHTVNLPESVGKVGTKVTNFEDLDFDAEDESVLHQAAMANAQNAVQEAQDRARAFNGEENQLQAQFDEGEMNFQNPTSLGSMDVTQPKMLTAQLKEYQLKGLNWLVNLYEQGINGILADEMGLGKTIQSISVMGYLAEKHNIWGPFLVIAPASTLHNWQQEITRFVPDLKVLPYWGTAKDRKVLRKFWDRKHITYTKESPFHVLVTSYQLVVMDTQYFQKIKWQYMILDEAQAIKSSQSSRWKSLLGFHCRNRLLLTGTPIQNNMQELWALLHFIMPSLFDSHDEFSDWFSKDIESHAQSNTKLNEDQLKRLHMILKPFMLRRVKKNVQKELGDKIEKDVFCDLTYRQRAYYGNLRNKISIMDLIEKAAVGDDQDTATLMNLVMQFRKVCNHPDLFERAETTSPFSFAHFAETASFLREGQNVQVGYSIRNLIEYDLPRLLCSPEARLDVPGPGNSKAGFRSRYLNQLMNIWTPEHIMSATKENNAFSWLRFSDTSAGELYDTFHTSIFTRAVNLRDKPNRLGRMKAIYDDSEETTFTPTHALFNIVSRNSRQPLADLTNEGYMRKLLNVSQATFTDHGLNVIEPCARPAATAPPISISCSDQSSTLETKHILFNPTIRQALYPIPLQTELALLENKIPPTFHPPHSLLPHPISSKSRYTSILVPSMRRFVTDSGKLAKLDSLLRSLKEGNHRVLLYFQMTRMIDLMEEYLTYRSYRYLRLDGSTKLEDRRDTVADFQTRPEIFIFLLSTRAGGLGINLTAADTVIFYDSDWNPTIDSQAMDRAHRLGQTKQVTVYRLITRGTIEERIRKRALQKEEVQRVVISGGSGAGVDFNTRSKENRTKDIALWLADDDQAEAIERKERELVAAGGASAGAGTEAGRGARKVKSGGGGGGRRKDVSLDDMYHEGEGKFDDNADTSAKPSGAATPALVLDSEAGKERKGRGGKGLSKKAKTAKQRLAIADASGELGMGGG